MLTVKATGCRRTAAGGRGAGVPACGGMLGGWGRARPRRVRVPAGPDQLRYRGGRGAGVRGDACAAAGAVPAAAGRCGRGDRRGAGGGCGRGRLPEDRAELGRPASTVRGWLRRFAGRAEAGAGVLHGAAGADRPGSGDAGRGGLAGGGGGVGVAGAAAAVAQRWPRSARCRCGRRRRQPAAGCCGTGVAGAGRNTTDPLRAAGRARDGVPVITGLTGGGARMGMSKAEEEQQARLERARAVGLFRYMLVREAADPALSRGSGGRWSGRSLRASIPIRRAAGAADPVDAGCVDPQVAAAAGSTRWSPRRASPRRGPRRR